MGAIQFTGLIRGWWFLVLVYLIDSGDGQRGNEDLDELRRDVRILHQLTDNIQHDMRLFYDEEKIFSEDLHKYEAPDHSKKHNKNRKHRKHNLNIPKHIKFQNPTYPDEKTFTFNTNNTHQNLKSINTNISDAKTNTTFKLFKNDKNKNDIYWPKFDEILRLTNSKYDWKNDRWIKLKNTSDEEYKKRMFKNSGVKQTKPKFIYSRVKINSGNSKRNIVIAISAMPKEN